MVGGAGWERRGRRGRWWMACEELALLYVCLLMIFASIALAERGGEIAPAAMAGSLTTLLSVWGCAAVSWCAMGIIARQGVKHIERTGSLSSMRRLERVSSASRLLVAIVTSVAVVGFDWLASLRASLGDWPLVDEALVTLPFLVTTVVGYYVYYPMERLYREAVILRDVEIGRPVQAMPERWAWAWQEVRHGVLLLILPAAALGLWTEVLYLAAGWVASQYAVESVIGQIGWWLRTSDYAGWVMLGLQLGGVLLIMLFIPAILLKLWDTRELPKGELRYRLIEMARLAGVRVRSIRVWHTASLTLNGALLGMLPAYRYVLLTDALLEQMPMPMVQAVMGHELGHARRRHIPWLCATLIVSGGLVTLAGGLLIALSFGHQGRMMEMEMMAAGATGGSSLRAWADVLTGVMAFIAAIVSFGFVSRMFERQADAFAVQHLSRYAMPEAGADMRIGPGGVEGSEEEGARITQPAIAAMHGALVTVAGHNNLAMDAFTFRHGSITGRLRHIELLAGQPIEGLTIDRQVTRIKVVIALGGAVMLGLLLAPI